MAYTLHKGWSWGVRGHFTISQNVVKRMNIIVFKFLNDSVFHKNVEQKMISWKTKALLGTVSIK